jgi:hypothetical protein
MSKFVLEIELGNSGMEYASQLSKALEKVADRIYDNDYDPDAEAVRGIMDENGNTVGSWRFEK